MKTSSCCATMKCISMRWAHNAFPIRQQRATFVVASRLTMLKLCNKRSTTFVSSYGNNSRILFSTKRSSRPTARWRRRSDNANKAWIFLTTASGVIIRWWCRWRTPPSRCFWIIAAAIVRRMKAQRCVSIRVRSWFGAADSNRFCIAATPTLPKQATWIVGMRRATSALSSASTRWRT